MCGPFGAILGGAVSAVGTIMQGQAQAAALKAQAKAAKYEAWSTRMAGQAEASKLADKGMRVRGDQIVAYASEGFDPTGTVSDVIVDTQQEIEFDKQMIRANAENKAKAKDYEAKIAKSQASAVKTGSIFSAAAGMVGAFSSAYAQRSTVGSAYTGGASPGGAGTPTQTTIPLQTPSKTGLRTDSVRVGGNIPAYGYPDIYGGPR